MGLRFFKDQMYGVLRLEAQKQPERLFRAMTIEMATELEEMKRRTPVWNPANPLPPGHVPGTLRASGRLDVEQVGKFIRAEISFGGLAEDYAFFVHEDTEAHHVTGQDHFMSSVLNESRPYIMERVGAHAQLGS